MTDHDACLECAEVLRGVKVLFHRDVHGDFQRTLEIVASFLESCGCGPLTTGWKSSEELPEADTWQFVEAHSRWRSVRVVVHPFTADSRTKALRRDMVWVDVSSRVLCAASEQVPLGSNTICGFTVQTLPKLPYSHRCDETHKRWRYFLQSFHGSAAEGWTSNALRNFDAAIEKYNVQ